MIASFPADLKNVVVTVRIVLNLKRGDGDLDGLKVMKYSNFNSIARDVFLFHRDP